MTTRLDSGLLLLTLTLVAIGAVDDPGPRGDNVCTEEREFVTTKREHYIYQRPHREQYPCWDPTKVRACRGLTLTTRLSNAGAPSTRRRPPTSR